MFDFAWSEIALIGIVALVLIGPKDLPVAIKAVAGMVKKARRMAGEFQVHVDEMVREADLHDVRREFNDLRRMDIKGKILNALDDDGSLRRTMSENPLNVPLTTPPPVSEAVAPAGHVVHADETTPVALAGEHGADGVLAAVPAGHSAATAVETAPLALAGEHGAGSLLPAAPVMHSADTGPLIALADTVAHPADAAAAPAFVPSDTVVAMVQPDAAAGPAPAMIPPAMIPPGDAKHPPQHA